MQPILQVIARDMGGAIGLAHCVGAIDEVTAGREDVDRDSISREIAQRQGGLD